jgi:hypothetical protein
VPLKKYNNEKTRVSVGRMLKCYRLRIFMLKKLGCKKM